MFEMKLRLAQKCTVCEQYIDAKRQSRNLETFPADRRGAILLSMGLCPLCTMDFPGNPGGLVLEDVTQRWHGYQDECAQTNNKGKPHLFRDGECYYCEGLHLSCVGGYVDTGCEARVAPCQCNGMINPGGLLEKGAGD